MTFLHPYPGIRPYEETDWRIFFGREGHTNELLRKLENKRFVAVVGSSGSGKSSLVKAGLLPLVHKGFLRGAKDWITLVSRPGRDPFGNLAARIVAQYPDAPDLSPERGKMRAGLVAAQLRASRQGILPALERLRQPSATHFLVVIDQFEELLGFRSSDPNTSVPRDVAELFVDFLLRSCAAPVPAPYPPPTEAERTDAPLAARVWMVLTMRSDFFGHCEAFPALADLMSRSQFLVPVLAPQQREEVIERPGRGVAAPEDGNPTQGGERVYLPFGFSPGLVQTLVNESGGLQDQLPLLAHALSRTWKLASRQAGGNGRHPQLSFAQYDAAGRIAGALDKDAELAWGELEREVLQFFPATWWPEGRPAAGAEMQRKKRLLEIQDQTRRMFLLLCTLSEEGTLTRRRPTAGEIEEATGLTARQIARIVRIFQRRDRHFLLPRFLPREKPAPDAIIDVSHEAILRQWVRYQNWQKQEQLATSELRMLLHHIEADGSPLSRKRLERVEDLLLRDGAARWFQRQVSEAEWNRVRDFCAQSREHLQTSAEQLRKSDELRSRLTREMSAKIRALKENKRAQREKKRAKAEQHLASAARELAEVESARARANTVRATERLAKSSRWMAVCLAGGLAWIGVASWQAAVKVREEKAAERRAVTARIEAVDATKEITAERQRITKFVTQTNDEITQFKTKAIDDAHAAMESVLGIASDDAIRYAQQASTAIKDRGSLFTFLDAYQSADQLLARYKLSPDEFKTQAESNKSALEGIVNAGASPDETASPVRAAIRGVIEKQEKDVADAIEAARIKIDEHPDGGNADVARDALQNARSLTQWFPRLEAASTFLSPEFQQTLKEKAALANDRLAKLERALSDEQAKSFATNDLQTMGKQKAFLLPHGSEITRAAFFPRGTNGVGPMILTGGADCRVVAWQLADDHTAWNQVWQAGMGSVVNGAAISPAGSQVAVATGSNMVVCDLAEDRRSVTAQRSQEIAPGVDVTAVAFSGDGNTIGATGAGGAVWLWKEDPGRHETHGLSLRSKGVLNGIRFANGNANLMAYTSDNFRTTLVNTLMGQLLWWAEYEAPARRAEFSPNDLFVTAAGNDSYYKIWRVAGGFALVVHGSGTVSRATFRPTEGVTLRVASGWGDGGVRLVNADPGGSGPPLKQSETLFDPRHDGPVTDVAWSSDGRWLASADMRGFVFIWDCLTVEHPTLVAKLSTGGSVDSVLWSPNHQWLATVSDGDCLLWEFADFTARRH